MMGSGWHRSLSITCACACTASHGGNNGNGEWCHTVSVLRASSRMFGAAGIPSGLVRLSVGITGTLEQRWLQLKQSFLAATSSASATKQPVVPGAETAGEVQAQKVVNIIASQHMAQEPLCKQPRVEGMASR